MLVINKENFPNWENSKKKLTHLEIKIEGTIEDSSYNTLQVDFSNQYIGGGVLGKVNNNFFS